MRGAGLQSLPHGALFGAGPSTTGIYDNEQDATPAGHILTRTVSLPGYFRERGYFTAGGGKLFGSAFGSVVKGKVWDDALEVGHHQRKRAAATGEKPAPLSGMEGKHDWGPTKTGRDEMEDWMLAGQAAEFLGKPHDKPFFLACGIVKPHTPWYVPKEYFDLFPPEGITLPNLAADESAGVPAVAREKVHRADAELKARRKEMVAAYLAASRYADDCVGRILDGLERGPHARRTVVVILGDNGYQFGEKNIWAKGRLWEGSAHVPLIITGPGVKESAVSTRPVSLLDLYPTLLELAGLPPRADVDGLSLVPLLKDPAAAWERPALTTSGFKNHSLRSERWRYIRYADGSEELYDHEKDPLEHKNVAGEKENAAVKEELKKWLPAHDEPRNPNAQGRKADD